MNMAKANWHNYLMIILLVFEAMLAAIQLPGQYVILGLTPTMLAWLSIINVGVLAAVNQLPAMGSSLPTSVSTTTTLTQTQVPSPDTTNSDKVVLTEVPKSTGGN
jgi:hypothetical protein